MRDIHISIVSHNQQNLVDNLLADLDALASSSRIQVTLTHNIPESFYTQFSGTTFPLNTIINTKPKGFAENHNYAYQSALSPKDQKFFIVANPDVRLDKDVITQLTCTLNEDNDIGLTAPIVINKTGEQEDSIRELPTPSRIFSKIFGNKGHWRKKAGTHPDWVAGMFMVFSTKAFEEVNGFDEKYFLYYEDVDICSRLWLSGYSIKININSKIVHDAQRASRHNLKYFRWHITSMLKFFSSNIYRQVKHFHMHRMNSGNLKK